MKLLIMGPPGVGKGTQAKQIKNKLNIAHLSTGEILRSEIDKNSNIGIIAKTYMNKGKLVPDQILLDIMQERITKTDCRKGYLLDGFPRTIPQAVGFDNILANLKQNLDIVINLTAEEKELIQRILKRRLESGRTDDTFDIIKKRQKIYWEKTAPLVEFYHRKGILKNVDGLGEIKIITKKILTLI